MFPNGPQCTIAGPPSAVALRTAECRAPATERFLISGSVHTCGGALVDSAGHRVRLLSFELLTLYPGQGDIVQPCNRGHWTAPPADLAGQIRPWGMNSVQILISWSNIEPTPPTPLSGGGLRHHWNTGYLDELDAVIAAFHAQHLAVVLSLGQSRWSGAFNDLRLPNGTVEPCGLGMPDWLYPRGGSLDQMVRAERRFYAGSDGIQAQFRRVWTMVARRYAHNPAVVGAEMLFEAPDIIAQPYLGSRVSPKDVDLAGFFERTGRAIHSVAPRLLLMYQDWLSLRSSVEASVSTDGSVVVSGRTLLDIVQIGRAHV